MVYTCDYKTGSVQHKWRKLNSKNIIKSIAKINIHRTTQQIICKAPIWNSTEWKEDVLSVSKLFGKMNY